MKVIIHHTTPFYLAQGGVTSITHKTKSVLEEQGTETEFSRWWDPDQKGDVLYFVCRPPPSLAIYAKQKGFRVAVEHVATGLVSRPGWKRRIQKLLKKTMQRTMPHAVTGYFGWEVFDHIDLHFVPSTWDRSVIGDMFDIPENKLVVLPYGVDDAFLNAHTPPREEWLVCTATITDRKRINHLCEAAVMANVPVRIVGAPYGESDPYYQEFARLQKANPSIILYDGPVNDRKTMADIYKRAGGFVLISTMETVSQSALEAAASGCPLLLSDQDWAHHAFGKHAQYCPLSNNVSQTAGILRQFAEHCKNHVSTYQGKSWPAARAELSAHLRALL
jgi:glycosyltransferase involved in cell wall biosynthesis